MAAPVPAEDGIGGSAPVAALGGVSNGGRDGLRPVIAIASAGRGGRRSVGATTRACTVATCATRGDPTGAAVVEAVSRPTDAVAGCIGGEGIGRRPTGIPSLGACPV